MLRFLHFLRNFQSLPEISAGHPGDLPTQCQVQWCLGSVFVRFLGGGGRGIEFCIFSLFLIPSVSVLTRMNQMIGESGFLMNFWKNSLRTSSVSTVPGWQAFAVTLEPLSSARMRLVSATACITWEKITFGISI